MSTFTAYAIDGMGNEEVASVIWNITGGGQVNIQGVFFALYAGTWTLWGNLSTTNASGTGSALTAHATIAVIPGSIVRYDILPDIDNISIFSDRSPSDRA